MSLRGVNTAQGRLSMMAKAFEAQFGAGDGLMLACDETPELMQHTDLVSPISFSFFFRRVSSDQKNRWLHTTPDSPKLSILTKSRTRRDDLSILIQFWFHHLFLQGIDNITGQAAEVQAKIKETSDASTTGFHGRWHSAWQSDALPSQPHHK